MSPTLLMCSLVLWVALLSSPTAASNIALRSPSGSQSNLCKLMRDVDLIPTLNMTFADGTIWIVSLCRPMDNLTIKYCKWNSTYAGGWSPVGSCSSHFPQLTEIRVDTAGLALKYNSGMGWEVVVKLACGETIGWTNVSFTAGSPTLLFQARSFAACF